jgi:hypothetical protein
MKLASHYMRRVRLGADGGIGTTYHERWSEVPYPRDNVDGGCQGRNLERAVAIAARSIVDDKPAILDALQEPEWEIPM